MELGIDPKILDAYLAENLENGAKPSEESAGKALTSTIREQIMAIRDSGETNMLDTRMVQSIANREGYHELVVYLAEHRKEYWNFIMTGDES